MRGRRVWEERGEGVDSTLWRKAPQDPPVLVPPLVLTASTALLSLCTILCEHPRAIYLQQAEG